MYAGRLTRRKVRSSSASTVCALVRDVVGDEADVARSRRPGGDRGAARTSGMAGQRLLDLAQLDAVTADLHLVVERGRGTRGRRRAAAGPGRRCGTAGRPLAGEGVGHEPLGGQLGPVQVAAGDARRRRCRARPARRPDRVAPSASSTWTAVLAIGRPIGTVPTRSATPATRWRSTRSSSRSGRTGSTAPAAAEQRRPGRRAAPRRRRAPSAPARPASPHDSSIRQVAGVACMTVTRRLPAGRPAVPDRGASRLGDQDAAADHQREEQLQHRRVDIGTSYGYRE